jgi:group I intron endonuclease
MFGKSISAETKSKISESLKGNTHSTETKEKMSLSKVGKKNPNFGKSHSTEAKMKMSTAQGIPVFVYSKDGLLVNNFISARQAGIFFNTDSKTIIKYC